MIITAYQTLEDQDNQDVIETEGPFKCTRTDAWLGHGYYFWDTNMDWAIGWGLSSYQAKGRKFVIGRCQLDLSKDCFDLQGNVAHQQDIIQAIEVMRESGKIQPHHKLILPYVIKFLRSKGLFPYKSIRANDNYQKVRQIFFNPDKQEYMYINQRVQVCVTDLKEVILRPFVVVYPEKS